MGLGKIINIQKVAKKYRCVLEERDVDNQYLVMLLTWHASTEKSWESTFSNLAFYIEWPPWAWYFRGETELKHPLILDKFVGVLPLCTYKGTNWASTCTHSMLLLHAEPDNEVECSLLMEMWSVIYKQPLEKYTMPQGTTIKRRKKLSILSRLMAVFKQIQLKCSRFRSQIFLLPYHYILV